MRRTTLISADLVRSPEFVELKRISAELKGKLMQPLKLSHADDEPIDINGWDEIAEQIEALGRKGLQIQRYKGLGKMNAEQL